MRAKITKRMAQSLEPSVKAYEVVDTEIAGFILRVQPSGSMNYYVSYSRPDRRRNRVRLGSSKTLSPTQARDKARAVLADVAKGHDPVGCRRSAACRTLDSFLDEEYGSWVVANRKTCAGTVAGVHSAFSDLLGMRLSNQVRDDLEIPEDHEQQFVIDLIVTTSCGTGRVSVMIAVSTIKCERHVTEPTESALCCPMEICCS
jgi:hypothetical protein